MEMANNIVLKTYKGGNVTPQDDAIIYQTVISTNGIFKGCEVTYARGNVLHISQGFGMIKGRFFEVYESEIAIPLISGNGKVNGRLYIHLDLSNADEPIQILFETGEQLSSLASDHDINYNNTAFDIELAAFQVSSTDLTDLEQTFTKITGASAAGGSGSGSAVSSLFREATYNKGDFAICESAPGWVTLYCTQSGETARLEPSGYRNIMKPGDTVLDGTCVFMARDVIGEIDALGAANEAVKKTITGLNTRIEEMQNDTADMVMKVLSYDAYRQLEERSDRIIYLCYEDAETKKITKVFVGGTKVYYTDVQVTYCIDNGDEVVKYLPAGVNALESAPEAEMGECTFLGWRADALAETEVLESCMVEKDTPLKLYAVFECHEEITLDFYGNGGEGEDPQEISATFYYNNGHVRSREKVSLPANPYTREGYLFAGWGHGAESLYKPGKQAYLVGDTTIVPIWLSPTVEFAYTGGSTQYKVPADGIYKLEVWGARGGAYYSGNPTYVAQGGHSKGYAKLKKGEMVYLAVGGAANGQTGGFNGGGKATGSGSSYYSYYGGGGCTHMAKLPGTLKDIGVENADKVLIVAGGGGGGQKYGSSSDSCAKGGDGGGLSGVTGGGNIGAGQQTPSFEDTSIQFGYGGDGYYAGGGGGWYGGNGGSNGTGYGNVTGGGGSGYVGGVASFSYNRVFYEAETEVGVQMGNGKAEITFITHTN